MQKVHYSIHIDAPVEKVWEKMLDDKTYRIWTKPFHPGSYFKGDWSKGSKILFIGPDENGKEMGMMSMIEENRPYEYISIKHMGIIADGVEDTTSDEVKKWVPAYENYTFKSANGGTDLSIDLDLNEEYVEQFNQMWPKALEKLKEISEK